MSRIVIENKSECAPNFKCAEIVNQLMWLILVPGRVYEYQTWKVTYNWSPDEITFTIEDVF